jgi:hypothetical protein
MSYKDDPRLVESVEPLPGCNVDPGTWMHVDLLERDPIRSTSVHHYELQNLVGEILHANASSGPTWSPFKRFLLTAPIPVLNSRYFCLLCLISTCSNGAKCRGMDFVVLGFGHNSTARGCTMEARWSGQLPAG